MGANSSSISELSDNDYLKRLSGNEVITPADPFWNQLLSYTFHVSRNSADQRLLEESVAILCKNFAINNCQTGNFGSLCRVFIIRTAELKSLPEIEDNIFILQTFNALFIIRNMCKYFVENLSEEVIIQQFDTMPPNEIRNNSDTHSDMGSDITGSMIEQCMNCLMELVVDIPLTDVTYSLHLEALNTLTIMFAVQMFHPTPACDSTIYKITMIGKTSIHAGVFMKTLIQNFINQAKCPKAILQAKVDESGLVDIVTSSLWSVMTLGLTSKTESLPENIVSDKLLSNQSLLLILVLCNHCTSNKTGLRNPYRDALLSFTNSQDTETSSVPTHSVATFKVDMSKLYNTLGETLHNDQTTLLLYLLIHQNHSVKTYVLSRTNLDVLVLPILRILYNAPDENSHHIYMALIILLILSEDESFATAVHDIVLKNVVWFKERPISEISLGGLLILVVIRTIQYNMTRMRDKYLHTNCLAALANMSAYFRNLHPYVSQRLVSLFALLQKKHTRLVDMIACKNHTLVSNSGDDSDAEPDDYVNDLMVLEEVIRMVLEIINSSLSHGLHQNINLIYTLLYQKEVFQHFSTHPTFQDIIQNIDTVLGYFTTQLDKADKNVSVPQVMDIIKQYAVTFKREKLRKFPELKFKYVEEDQPEEFFIPYVWSLVFHASTLYFNPQKIRLFSLHSGET